MKQTLAPRVLEGGAVEPAHEVQVVCAACGYDLDAAELDADTCSDCGKPLSVKQSIAIQVTTVPAASGAAM